MHSQVYPLHQIETARIESVSRLDREDEIENKAEIEKQISGENNYYGTYNKHCATDSELDGAAA